jgi:hypothetical protein
MRKQTEEEAERFLAQNGETREQYWRRVWPPEHVDELRRQESGDLHSCEAPKNIKSGGYGDAITDCDESSNGELWVGNGEYASQVNFCPFCGFKAKIQIEK